MVGMMSGVSQLSVEGGRSGMRGGVRGGYDVWSASCLCVCGGGGGREVWGEGRV